MLQIRLTKSAAKDLKITTLDAPVAQDSPFNDWFMNVFILHRKKVAIFTHGATKLSFFSQYSDIGGSKNLKYNHLVANMVILYNVNEMSRIIKDLISEGVNIDHELLRYFSPYKSQHIARLGFYEVGKYVKSGNIIVLDPTIDIFSKYWPLSRLAKCPFYIRMSAQALIG